MVRGGGGGGDAGDGRRVGPARHTPHDTGRARAALPEANPVDPAWDAGPGVGTLPAGDQSAATAIGADVGLSLAVDAVLRVHEWWAISVSGVLPGEGLPVGGAGARRW